MDEYTSIGVEHNFYNNNYKQSLAVVRINI